MKEGTDSLFSCTVYTKERPCGGKTPWFILSALFCPRRSVGAEYRLCVLPGSRLSAASLKFRLLVVIFLPVFWLTDRNSNQERERRAEINHRSSVEPTRGPYHMAATCLLTYFKCSNTQKSDERRMCVCVSIQGSGLVDHIHRESKWAAA